MDQSFVDEDNKPVWQWPYSAFGANKPTGILQATPNPRVAITNQPVLLKATAATELNLRFPGQYFDSETNLHYNYFRSYQPNQGRYTQGDPIGLDGGLNRFGYVEGDSINKVDIDGRFPMYGNWGGANWSGGASGSNIPLFPKKPKDSLDACYMAHDYCYAGAQQGRGSSQMCTKVPKTVPACDAELAKCTMAVNQGSLGTWGRIFGPLSTVWAIFKGELGK